MRLIDADALLDDVRKHSVSYFADDFAKEWVDKQPTLDAAPVRRGKWILQGDSRKALYGWYFCSECGAFIGGKTNFCSECGAIMGDGDG